MLKHARNIAIILAVAAVVALVPGGGRGASAFAPAFSETTSSDSAVGGPCVGSPSPPRVRPTT